MFRPRCLLLWLGPFFMEVSGTCQVLLLSWSGVKKQEKAIQFFEVFSGAAETTQVWPRAQFVFTAVDVKCSAEAQERVLLRKLRPGL